MKTYVIKVKGGYYRESSKKPVKLNNATLYGNKSKAKHKLKYSAAFFFEIKGIQKISMEIINEDISSR